MKLTVKEAVLAYRSLERAKLDAMRPKERIEVVRSMRRLKTAADDYDDFVKMACAKLRPAGYDRTEAVLRDPSAHTPAEVAEAEKASRGLEAAVAECLAQEEARTLELDITPVDDETLGRLLAPGGLTGAMVMAIDAALCRRKDGETNDNETKRE